MRDGRHLRGHRLAGTIAALAAVILLGFAVTSNGAFRGVGGLGKPGDPVHLTIGYHPYYTGGWSGLVIKRLGLWKKYLPKGSTVDYQVGLQGTVIVGRMLAGKAQIGYVGDMPALIGVSKRAVRDLRIVASLHFETGGDACNVLMVRANAPKFRNAQAAVRWMSGKRFATQFGSCSDRFAQSVWQKTGVTPSEYLNQSVEVMASNFKNGRLDAGVTWEPVPSRLVNDGAVRRVGSAANFHITDGGFLLMSKELLDQRPDVAEGYLRAELEAQRYLADPRHAQAIAKMAMQETVGYTEKDLWDALHRRWPPSEGGRSDGVKFDLPFVISPAVRRMVLQETGFLVKTKTLAGPLPKGAIDDRLARKVLRASGLPRAGIVRALPEPKF